MKCIHSRPCTKTPPRLDLSLRGTPIVNRLYLYHLSFTIPALFSQKILFLLKFWCFFQFICSENFKTDHTIHKTFGQNIILCSQRKEINIKMKKSLGLKCTEMNRVDYCIYGRNPFIKQKSPIEILILPTK